MACDLVFDAGANGQQLKCLTAVNEFAWECSAIDVASGIRSSRVIELVSIQDLGDTCDRTPLLSSAIGDSALAHAENIETAVIDPDTPWQNGLNESFNGKSRKECLSMQWFKSRIDPKILISGWH